MRIAHILLGRCNPDSANGVDKTVYYLSRSQAALGNKVAVFSLTSKPPIPIPGVLVKTFPVKGFPFRLPQSLLTELSTWKPDIVHFHSVYVPQNAALGYWLRRRGIPYVVTPNGGLSPHVLRRKPYLKLPYKVLFELPLLNRAIFVHAVGDADDIRNYGVRVPIVTAPNGLDLGAIPPALDKTMLASRFPQMEGKRVFMFLGRLDPLHKGLDLLLEGFAGACLGNAVLVLVGPDWERGRNELEMLSRQVGIASQVIFAGPAYGKEKFDILAGADIFVHTSRWEGLSFSVLEAAAIGLPCLVTPPADPYGMLSRYRGGIVVDPNPHGIATGLRRFAAMEKEELQAMGVRAREMVEREFNWESIAETILEAYETHAARSKR